jgi:hypothetical protein
VGQSFSPFLSFHFSHELRFVCLCCLVVKGAWFCCSCCFCSFCSFFFFFLARILESFDLDFCDFLVHGFGICVCDGFFSFFSLLTCILCVFLLLSGKRSDLLTVCFSERRGRDGAPAAVEE